MWNLLSWLGSVSEEDVSAILDEANQRNRDAEHTDIGQCDADKKRRATEAKARLRFVASLERRLKDGYKETALSKSGKRLLQRLRNGSLKREANKCVLAQGRGRLHGDAPGDYLDIGANQDISVVAARMDGPRPQPCIDRFRH